MIYPLRISHAAKRYLPKEGCSHSLGARRRARRGVYRYVSLLYGLHQGYVSIFCVYAIMFVNLLAKTKLGA
jgi:hypothetical protein